jgi:hypothetical protein
MGRVCICPALSLEPRLTHRSVRGEAVDNNGKAFKLTITFPHLVTSDEDMTQFAVQGCCARAVWRLAVTLMLAMPMVDARADRIDEARFVAFGGIEQWITLHGEERTHPVLLILHGGPGESTSLLAPAYRPFEHDFVVVQWTSAARA